MAKLKPLLDAEAEAMTEYHAVKTKVREGEKFEHLTAHITAI